MSIGAFFSLLFIFMVFAASPGPGLAILASKTLQKGAAAAYVCMAGLLLGDVIYLSLSYWGLSLLAQRFTDFLVVVQYLGAAYLIILGLLSLRNLPKAEAAPSWHAGNFLMGFIVTISSPKAILFYLSLLPTFITMSMPSWQDYTVLIIAMLGGVGGFAALFVWVVYWTKRRFSERFGWMRYVGAFGLIGAGVFLAVR